MIWWPYVLAGCWICGCIGFVTAALMVMSKRSDADEYETPQGWQGRRP